VRGAADTRVEIEETEGIDEVVERETGTEIVAPRDVMREGMTMIDHQGEIEICLMTDEVEVDDEAIGVTATAALETGQDVSARRA
jgi:hypothetical protein